MTETDSTRPRSKERQMRAKLIFNPGAGAAKGSPPQIMDVIHEMQAWNIVPEAFLIEEGCDLPGMVQDALNQGLELFVVCGGDGTISPVAGILAGTGATLGIIPLGTQNNMALSLGIPEDVPAAVAILRTGRQIQVDVGMATYQSPEAGGGEITVPFLELCSVGLVSELFPPTDDIQHGNLARAGDLLATLVSSTPAEIHLILDGMQDVRAQGHVVLVTNMPYVGSHYLVGEADSYDDGLLDVLFFADLGKLDLVNFILYGVQPENMEDPRIQRFRVHRVEINTEPAMAIMADGVALGAGPVQIEVRPRVLNMMAGQPAPAAQPAPDEVLEKTYATAG